MLAAGLDSQIMLQLCRFAPLSIPSHRRLQTFAVLFFALLLPISLAIFFLALQVSRREICEQSSLISFLFASIQLYTSALAVDFHIPRLDIL